MRNRFRESRARLHRYRNPTLTAIILLRPGSKTENKRGLELAAMQ